MAQRAAGGAGSQPAKSKRESGATSAARPAAAPKMTSDTSAKNATKKRG